LLVRGSLTLSYLANAATEVLTTMRMPTRATAGETILYHGIPMTRSSAYVLSYEASRDRAAATSAAFGKLVKKVNEAPVPLAEARIRLAEVLRPHSSA
jgi:hypothetical protein